jgi:hypothetical protein
MVDIKISGDHLDVEFIGWSKLWALRSRLEIPIASIKEVRADGNIPKGYYIRAFGTGIRRMIRAGIFTDFKRWAFFDLRADRVNVVIMKLAGWKYDAVALQVKDARASVEMICSALASRGNPGIG